MDMVRFCDHCRKEVVTYIDHRKETYVVRGEEIEVDSDVLRCTVCGSDIFCEQLDNETLKSVYNRYRKTHNFFFPEEIKNLREYYRMSQNDFDDYMHWDSGTTRRYENGSLQTERHNAELVSLQMLLSS